MRPSFLHFSAQGLYAVLRAGLVVYAVTTQQNPVGYSTQGVTGGSLSCVGLQFSDVAADGLTSIANLALDGVTPGEWDTMETDAPCIMLYNGVGYDFYYYISDAGADMDQTAWADGAGDIVTDQTALGTGLWLRMPERETNTGSLTSAGQVESAESATVDIANGLTLACNPYPMALDMSKVVTTGLVPGEWDTMETSAPCLMIYNGVGYDFYYYISDAGADMDQTAWADGAGDVIDVVAGVGEAFWIRSTSTGTLTFTK